MKTIILTGACALGLSACATVITPLPDTASQLAASNPSVTSPVAYPNPLAGYRFRAPTGPRDWREVNQEQSEGN
jgi:hypothetical protein